MTIERWLPRNFVLPRGLRPNASAAPQANRPFRLPEAVVAMAIYSGALFNGYDSTAGQAICCIVNALLLVFLVLMTPPPPAFWRHAAPVLGLGAFALLWGIVVTMRADGGLPDYAPGKILSIVAGWAALLSGAVMARRRSRRRVRLLDWLLALNCLTLLLGLALRQSDGSGPFDYWAVVRDDRFQGTIGNINVTAALAGANALLAFRRLLSLAGAGQAERTGALRFLFYLLAFTLCTGVVLLTASRFTNLLLFGLLAAAAVLKLKPRRRARRFDLRLVAAGIGLLVLVLVTQYTEILQERLEHIGAGWDERARMLRHFAELALRRPLTGYGLGSFPSVNAHFLDTPRYAQATWAINSPHNVILQLMLGGGLPYLLATLGAAAWGLSQVARAMRKGPLRDDLTILGMLTLIVGCAMIDVVLDVPASASFTLFLAGLLWGAAFSEAGSRYRRGGSRSSGP